MVWIPKYRRMILGGEVAERLKEILLETAAERGGVGSDCDGGDA